MSLGFCGWLLYSMCRLWKPQESVAGKRDIVVQSLSRVQHFVTPQTAACQASLSFTTPGVGSDSCPLSRWCHPTISSSVTPFSSCPQCFAASGSFPMRYLFASGGASASVLPMNIQGWFPLGLTSLISLMFKGLSRAFTTTTVQKHQFFFMVQLSHLYMTTGKPIALTIWTFVSIVMSPLFNLLFRFWLKIALVDP